MTNNKVCEQCKKDYECTNTMGHEQKYCSKVCRNKAANTRRIQKIKNDVYEKENNKRTETNTIGEVEQQQHNNILRLQNPNSFNYFTLMESKYQTMNENNFYKLKVEGLEKEFKELESDYMELEGRFNEAQETIGKIDPDEYGFKKMVPLIVPELFKIFMKPKDVAPQPQPKVKTEL